MAPLAVVGGESASAEEEAPQDGHSRRKVDARRRWRALRATPYGAVMEEKLLNNRRLCLDQAQSFIEAAERLGAGWPYIVYHLSLLALEEVGKANILGAQMINHANLDGSWIERSLDSHRRKLQWAVWSPMVRIDPADFEAARQFAERAHSMRLASLYVDAKADLTDLPPSERVQRKDAEHTLSLARARLDYERARGTPSGEIDDLTKWFLDTMADPDLSRVLLSNPFIVQFEAMNSDARTWTGWAREELARLERESREVLEAELARPGAPKGSAKPRWRANAAVYTPSHSLRSKALARWNDQIDAVQLVESFWGDGRAVALTDQHIDHAIHCMMAFAPLPEAEAAPIFEPYFHGLALIAKSDVFYNFDILARHAFVNSLAGALRRYGGWSGKPEDFETSLHEGFAPFMPNREDRDQMFSALKTEGDPAETSLVNLRSAKQLADLYLIHTARRTWRTILDRTAGTA